MKFITTKNCDILPVKSLSFIICCKALLVLCCLFIFTHAQAGGGIEEKLSGTPMKGLIDVSLPASFALTANKVSILDYYGFVQQTTQQNKTIKNVITFSINEASTRFIQQDFTATATVQIEYGHSASSIVSPPITKTFTVDYKKAAGAKYNAKQYFSFDAAEFVKITLVSINAPTLGSLDTRDILVLENDMIVTRFFELPNIVPAPTSFGITTQTLPPSTVQDHLELYWSWPINTGNNATQLEWAWIENEMAADYMIGGVPNNDLIFANSTRVDLPYNKLNYDIPLLYDGIGKLYYRIRAVNIKESGNRSDGPWNIATAFDFNGHNNNLNWQSTTSFAEEGKRKSVIQYFDGSLRGRQTVTKDNSTNTVVTAESFYDGQGRPVIQILPTPGLSSIIQYQANLNLFNGQVANQDPSEIFDMQPIATPNSLTPALLTSTGTSKYYSAANTTGPANLPDAEGYPYTVTRFTPDATGRVMSQSGVGAAHKLGTGHETKYWYGGAAQEELDGLFGTEVGNYTHYSKNMVKDANGQMSISYVDNHGRTIATALAGDAPTNLQPLNTSNATDYPNQAGTFITRNLLDNNTNVVKGNGVESINNILVPATTNYLFTYQLNPETLQVPSCPDSVPATLCYDCLYDLEIAITDESGEGAAPLPIVLKFGNISVSPVPDDNCATPVPPFTSAATNPPLPVVTIVNNAISFTQQLAPGSYSVRKTLSISEASLQKYKDLYASKAICKKEQLIIDSIYTVLLNTTGCASSPTITCQNCVAQLGTPVNFRQAYLISIGLATNTTSVPAPAASTQVENDITSAYNQAKRNCELLCNSTAQNLPTIREMMLGDMVPFTGQYASETAADYTMPPVTGSHTMFDKYNIFATGASGQPFYKKPWNTTKQLDFYKDNNNNTDQTIHPVVPIDDYVKLNNTAPNGATNGDGFVQIFKQSWAKALLPHHPEYDRLVFAENTLQNSYNWINTFSQTDLYNTNTGYLNPVGIDPFFIQSPSDIPNINNAILNYRGMGVGMWQLAYGEVRCKSIVNIAQRQQCYTSAPNVMPTLGFPGFTAAENHQAWKIFRGLYAAVRNDYVNLYIANTVPLPAGEEAALIAQNYRLWFPRDNQQAAAQNQWPWWPANINTAPGNGGGVPTSNPYEDRCTSYINTWKAKLLQCAALAARADKDAILLRITNRMKMVCVNGSNQANPYGSSNIAPGVVAADQSFEDVIKNVFQTYGIVNANGIYNDNYCNPFVIDWPKPYGKGPKMLGGEMTGQIDSCNCKAFATIKTQATTAGFNPAILASLNVYLQQHYGEPITQGMFDGLQHCNELLHINCTTRDTIIRYKCNEPTPTCLNAKGSINNGIAAWPLFICKELDALIVKFFDTYPGLTGRECRERFIMFFQETYGYNVSWDTWEEIAAIYLKACGKELSICPLKEFDCKELNALIAEFHIKFPDATGDACMKYFVDFFQQHFGYNEAWDTWEEIAAIYLNNCGIVLDVCNTTQYDCKELQSIIDLFNTYENPGGTKCNDLFVVLFNQHFGTTYTWQQIVDIYWNSCKIRLSICDPIFNCEELQGIINQYYSIYGYNLLSNRCQINFVNLFNAHYGTSYTWQQIVDIYFSTCEITLDVCNNCIITCTKVKCDTTYGAYILPLPQPLPAFLKCGYVYNPPCISCAVLSTLTGEYKAKFTPAINTAPIFVGSNLTPDQISYNTNYARFINYRTGYQFGWLDYSKAAANATPACNLANYATNNAALQNVICGSTTPLTQVPPNTPNPCAATYSMAVTLGQQIYNIRVETVLKQFDEAYKAKCLAAKDIEQFSLYYKTSEYHYTLYYYDMAGNLVKTVPPKGVNPDFSVGFTNSIKTARNSGSFLTTPIPRPHTFATEYRYNSLNQVVAQKTPDAGISNFWYDALGRLVVSQNAKQKLVNNYSYTLYDALGRIKEVGQKPQAANSMNQTVSQDGTASATGLQAWLGAAGYTKEQITATVYDDAFAPLAGSPTFVTQQNLRNRVSYTYTKKLETDLLPAASTYYTYDIHGNVDRLLQDYYDATATIPNHDGRYKLMAYDYDLISGKVNNVRYQPGYTDAFYHKYKYDAENRITEVYTSRDKIAWERDAAYNYYKHGPLARTELGQLQVQGIDYTYTLQGWLKGINQSSLDPTKDIGHDGMALAGTTPAVARDILSFGLHYYDETVGTNNYTDYKPISGSSLFAVGAVAPTVLAGAPLVGGTSLYNGNITAMAVNNAGLLGNAATNAINDPLLYRYKYDQLNRIVSMDAFKGLNTTNNAWAAVSLPGQAYKETTSYDPNGNIVSYTRNGDAARPLMDNMAYSYVPNKNQLDKVVDAAPDAAAGDYDKYNDIKKFKADGVTPAQANANYTYDDIGNLVSDASEGISNISWSVYGKILSITKASGTITYGYDASGNRVSKTYPLAGGGGATTIYVRDASGNVMSVYEFISPLGGGGAAQAIQKETHLYGSSRLGILNSLTFAPTTTLLTADFGNASFSTFTRGEKIFELSNHLGNVLVTVSDKKLAVDSDNDGVINYYTADVVTANDYYPFGSQMPGRKYAQANSSYRYGFNGKENDKDAGEGIQDYGKRIYDTRIGKFLSVDPLSAAYPFYSPYQFSGNDVIRCIDLDGGEPTSRTEAFDQKSVSFIHEGKGIDVYDKVQHQLFAAFGVKDPNTGKIWIVANDASGKWFYLKNDNATTNLLYSGLMNGERILLRSHFAEFDTQNEKDKRSGAAIADGIGKTLFGLAAVVAALPALAAAGSGGAAWFAGSGESGATILSAALGDGAAAYGTAGAVGAVAAAAAYGETAGDGIAVEGMLQNDANVVRGGIATEEGIIKSSERIHPSGIRGFSVESSNGLTAEELSRSKTVPNGKMNVTTVGDIRAAGGQVTPTTGGSPNHATVSGLNPAQAVKVLGEPITNPNPTPKK